MEPIVNNYFAYKTLDEIEAANKEFTDMMDSEEDVNSEDIDADDLFK